MLTNALWCSLTLGVAILGLCGCLGGSWRSEASDEGDVTWTSIYLGEGPHGDAHLVRGSKLNILIDTGVIEKAQIVADHIPGPTQHTKGGLDYVIITHPHYDHYAGLVHLLNRQDIRIDTIYFELPTFEVCSSEAACVWSDLQTLQRLAENRSPAVAIRSLKDFPSEGLWFGGQTRLKKIVQLSYDETVSVGQSINNTSAVFRLDVGAEGTPTHHRVLFTGDIDAGVGKWLMQNAPDQITASVLKIPHHGADHTGGDTEFIRNVKPAVAIISATRELWCNARCDVARNTLRELGLAETTYVNGICGDLHVRLFEDGRRHIQGVHHPCPGGC
jgi:beta-lactamase superfamily II metal-dependent hydrolase